MRPIFLHVLFLLTCCSTLSAQIVPPGNPPIDEDQLGAWYMYFFRESFGESEFGIQGDYQFRFYEVAGDLEQILLRTGLTYTPEDAGVTFTLGYGHIISGTFGESTETSTESRIYQEALLPQRIGERFLLTHRFRYEQRFVEDQDFRTRYRYNLFINVPLNGTSLDPGVVHLALYNELFMNGQREIGDARFVELFDRNRLYLGLGYVFSEKLRTQLGWMQQTTNAVQKGQLQVSLHHSW